MLKRYHNDLTKHPHTSIAAILDPRYNHAVFAKLYSMGHELTDVERGFLSGLEQNFAGYSKEFVKLRR